MNGAVPLLIKDVKFTGTSAQVAVVASKLKSAIGGGVMDTLTDASVSGGLELDIITP